MHNIANGTLALPPVPFVDPLAKSILNPYLVKAVTVGLPVDTALAPAGKALDKALQSQGYFLFCTRGA